MTDLNWHTWLKHGDQYLGADKEPKPGKKRFGGDIRYNVLSMAFEAYAMAILDYHKNLPDNHTYTDLIYGLERVIGLDVSLKERILKYENIQEICSVEKFHIARPTDDELEELKQAIREIGELAHSECKA